MKIFKLLHPFIAGVLCTFLLAGFAETGESHESSRTLELINESNQRLQPAESCRDCTTQISSRSESLLRPGSRSMAKACSQLMDAQGDLGPSGQSLFSIMAEPPYREMYTRPDALGSFCPNFNQLTDKEKLLAWTWFWTALAKEESSCNPTQKHGTTYRDKQGQIRVLNPREGYGLWALERDRNVRRWRGQACSNIGTVEGQARCSIDIMMKTQLNKGRTAGVNSMSYWGPVRRGHSQIMPHMRRLSLCF